jgi:hypothetical protein
MIGGRCTAKGDKMSVEQAATDLYVARSSVSLLTGPFSIDDVVNESDEKDLGPVVCDASVKSYRVINKFYSMSFRGLDVVVFRTYENDSIFSSYRYTIYRLGNGSILDEGNVIVE